MGKYAVVPTTREHIEEMVETMREADRDEIWVALHWTPRQALEDVFKSKGAMTGLANGEVVCIFGVHEPSLLGPRGVPWLLASDLITKYAKPFLRRNKAYLQNMRERYAFLENYVDARNTQAIKWLGWLGFKLEEAKPYGYEGMLFHRFTMRN